MDRPTDSHLTFLFTDVEGSTRLWEHAPEAMKTAHARQSDLIVEAVERLGGEVVRNRGEGDSTFSVFNDPPAAIAAACDFQLALHAQTWPADAPIRVRAAIHCGAAELRNGDYNSTAVNRCARIRALAYGGQTLVSHDVFTLVASAMPSGASLMSLGSHRLKDLQQPEQIYQLIHPALPSDFPALRSLDMLPTNLPCQITTFIGRERETSEIRDFMGKTRLLTLTGAGGAGKSRLAVQVAAEVLDSFHDGVWLVELAAVFDPLLTAQAIATSLGVREEPGRSVEESLLRDLSDREILLIIDNCEHLIAECARLIETLLRRCPNLRILATSREALAIPGEISWRIPSLSLPTTTDPRYGNAVEEIQRSESARLFIERVSDSLPRFVVSERNATAIAQVCRRLDGIPLALELAAARVRVLSVEQIADRLDDRFRLLTGGSRTALPRQQTLRALIDWSYDLLSEPEQTLFRRLAVFSGGWTLESAEDVCGDCIEISEANSTVHPSSFILHPSDVLDALSHLVDKSLVVLDDDSGARYRYMETVRQYARDRLSESGEMADLRNRHMEWCVRFAEPIRGKIHGPEGGALLQSIDADIENLRAGLQWATEVNPLAAAEIAIGLDRYWLIRGYLAEACEAFDRILATDDAFPAADRARLLRSEGVLLLYKGDYEKAKRDYLENLELSKALRDEAGIAISFSGLSNLAGNSGSFREALKLCEQSLQIWRELNSETHIGIELTNMGRISVELGNLAASLAYSEEALAVFRRVEDNRIAWLLGNLAHISRQLGRHAEAEAYALEAIALSEEATNHIAMAHSHEALAALLRDRGEHAAARKECLHAIELHREANSKYGAASGLVELGDIEREVGDLDRARRCYEESLSVAIELESVQLRAAGTIGMAHLARAEGDLLTARSLFIKSMRLNRNHGEMRQVECLEGLALLDSTEGNHERAVMFFGTASTIRKKAGSVLSPFDQQQVDLARLSSEQNLNEADAIAARKNGEVMSLDRAIELALEGTITHVEG